jgi:hypothetical protein
MPWKGTETKKRRKRETRLTSKKLNKLHIIGIIMVSPLNYVDKEKEKESGQISGVVAAGPSIRFSLGGQSLGQDHLIQHFAWPIGHL